jgi:hypothetical protein
MKKVLLALTVLCVSICLMGQSDQERGHSPGSGLFLSMSVGPSYMSINDDITGASVDNMTFKGIGIAFDAQFGAVLKENLIAHGDIIFISSVSVDLTIDGEAAATIEGENSISMTMFGAGITHYIMPQNIFLSGTIGVGGFSISTADETANTQKGFGLFFKAGKEWYVTKNWDLGFNISVNYTNVNNEVDPIVEKLTGFSVGVGFNATFN